MLLVISHAGRGLIEVSSGERVARDYEVPTVSSSWIDDQEMSVEGIGPAQNQWFSVVGLWGGELKPSNHDHWSVHSKSSGNQDVPYIRHAQSGAKWLVDTPVTEIRAFGFSPSGRILVLATSSEVSAYVSVA